MGANIAGIYGAQIFRADDKPMYRRGFSINIAVLTVGAFLAVVRYVDDIWRRRKIAKQVQDDFSDQTSQDEEKRRGSIAGVVNDLKAVAPRTRTIG